MPKALSFSFLAFLTLFTSNLHARVIHVPGDSTTIQGGIDGAVDGDTVMISPGTYYEYDIDFFGKAITVMGTDRGDPGVVAATIVDGDLRGGVFIFQSGEDAASVLAGLTVTRGYAPYGGGMYCVNSSPTVINCTFSQNRADDGGGIYNRYSCNPIVTNSILWGDTGGEIYIYNSTLTVIYSNVQGSYPGEGNINTVPLFRDMIAVVV